MQLYRCRLAQVLLIWAILQGVLAWAHMQLTTWHHRCATGLCLWSSSLFHLHHIPWLHHSFTLHFSIIFMPTVLFYWITLLLIMHFCLAVLHHCSDERERERDDSQCSNTNNLWSPIKDTCHTTVHISKLVSSDCCITFKALTFNYKVVNSTLPTSLSIYTYTAITNTFL